MAEPTMQWTGIVRKGPGGRIIATDTDLLRLLWDYLDTMNAWERPVRITTEVLDKEA